MTAEGWFKKRTWLQRQRLEVWSKKRCGECGRKKMVPRDERDFVPAKYRRVSEDEIWWLDLQPAVAWIFPEWQPEIQVTLAYKPQQSLALLRGLARHTSANSFHQSNLGHRPPNKARSKHGGVSKIKAENQDFFQKWTWLVIILQRSICFSEMTARGSSWELNASKAS